MACPSAVLLLCLVFCLVNGESEDSNSCKNGKFECQCGASGRKFHVPIKQCAYPHRTDKNKTQCKPCGNANEKSFCRKFRNCAECNNKECTKCPRNKYGKSCTSKTECSAPKSGPQVIWSSKSFGIGAVITAKCKDGFFLKGNNTLVCNEHGKWSARGPTCESSSCPMPNITRNMLPVINPGQTSKLVDANGKEVVIEIGFLCEAGFSLDGPAKIRCQPTGQWDQKIPRCIGTLLCPPPDQVHKGEIEISSGKGGSLVPGTILKIICKNTHYLYGPEIVSCTTAGKWSSDLPKCLKKFGCPPPSTLDNGTVEITQPVGHTAISKRSSEKSSRISHRRRRAVKLEPPQGYSDVNSRALYACTTAFYNLIGPASRVCQSNGQWSGQEPKCVVVCGRAGDSKQPSIINGTVTKAGQWPWQAGIAIRRRAGEGFSLACGGSLVSEQFVLTAAHCVTERHSSRTRPLDNFQIYLGKHYRFNVKDDSQVLVNGAQSIVIHHNYHPSSFDSDIALIKLIQPVHFTHRISPVCLPLTNVRTWMDDLPENITGTVVGWGLDENYEPSDELKAVTLPVVNREKCERDYRGARFDVTLTTNMFCAGLEKGGLGSCDGDSGGPFMVESSSGQEVIWIQEGIVSFGSEQCAAAKQYSGFLKVSNFVGWINQFL